MSENGAPLVLNVDDDEAQRYVKSRDLRLSGFNVVEANSGAQALSIVERDRPLVVLLDVQLPDILGPEVCIYVKRRWPEVMVLLTSSTFTSSEARTIGLDSGADSYLVQPAERLELAAAINSLLRIRKSEDELRALNADLERKIEERTAELRQINAKLVAEIDQREKAETALIQAQKMEAVGHLTGGLAHDFNNLLTAVIGSLEIIEKKNKDPSTSRWTQNALTAAKRGAKLTSQLLAFSRSQKLDATAVDVNLLIQGMSALLSQTLGATIEIHKRLDPDLPFAVADSNQLELAILNLCINSRDAMPGGGGAITLSTSFEPAKQMVVLSVADTGSGMPPDVVARAFDPFFTTKPPGKGTGLGLSQVFGVVNQLGGDVSISSKPGQGTEVRIRLRRSDSRPQTVLKEEQALASSSAERVLIVDDDDDVRRVMTGILSEAGYKVWESATGAAALEAMADFKPEIAIIDFAMPGQNGAEIAQAIRRTAPQVRIVFVTGYADDHVLESLGGHAPVLRKPFRPIELAALIRSALDAVPH